MWTVLVTIVIVLMIASAAMAIKPGKKSFHQRELDLVRKKIERLEREKQRNKPAQDDGDSKRTSENE